MLCNDLRGFALSHVFFCYAGFAFELDLHAVFPYYDLLDHRSHNRVVVRVGYAAVLDAVLEGVNDRLQYVFEKM